MNFSRERLHQYQFLRAGGFRSPDNISEIVIKADELIESIYESKSRTVDYTESAGEKSTEYVEGHQQKDSQQAFDVHRLVSEDAPFELHPIKKHFTCTLQYNSETEYERIIKWANESSSGGILKFAKDDSRTAEEVASDQMRELNELADFRRKLFHLSSLY